MKHIKQYEEIEWSKLNPINLIKGKSIDSVLHIIQGIKIDNVELSSRIEDKKIIIDAKVDNRIDNIKSVNIVLIVDIDTYKNIKIGSIEYNFNISQAPTYYVYPLNDIKTEDGILSTNKGEIKILRFSRILISPDKIETDIRSSISEYVGKIDFMFNRSLQILKSIFDSKKSKIELKSKRDNLLLDKDDIVECFGDLIDLSADHEVTSKDSIVIEFRVPGIEINEQRKSKSHYTKYGSTSFTFDEAHIVINDIFIEVSSALISAKSQLKSINNDIEIRSIFKNDIVIIEIYIPEEIKSTSRVHGIRMAGPR